MNVLRLLREPRWMRGLAVAILVACVCCLLGRWQWHRRQERLAANAPLVQNYDKSPVDVTEVLPAGSTLATADVWTPVRVTGRYDTAATVLVRNRPHDDDTGYDVLVPLVLADGSALLVDRGWVPAGSSSERPDSVPAAPGGEVTVTARLRQWEPARRGTTPAGQVGVISATATEAATTAAGAPPLLGGYAVLAAESPTSASAPALADRPDLDEGPHLAYTVQWFGFALTALVVWVVAGRRELQARADGAEEQDAPAGRDDGAGAGATPAGAAQHAGTGGPVPAEPRDTSRRPPRTPRPGSDEAAEDALLDAVEHRS